MNPVVALAQERYDLLPALDSTGIGVRFSYRLENDVAIRTSFNYLPATESDRIAGHDLSGASLYGVGVNLDYYPFSGPFFVSGGMRLVSASIDHSGEAQFGYGIKTRYRAQVAYHPVAPVATVGYRASRNGANFYLEVGAMMLRERSVQLRADPVIAPHPMLQPGIDAAAGEYISVETDRLRSLARKFGIYPLVGVRAVIPF